jgi:hypothetical protein
MRPLARYALSLGAAAALLLGCGGSQPPIGAPGPMPQSPAIATHDERGTSWMLPEAQSDALLYVSSATAVSVFSYPRGSLEKSLNGLELPFGACTDPQGHVYVVDQKTQTIREYNHGGQRSIRKLTDSPNWPSSCAVDPTNGDLAVSGGVGHGFGTSSNIAIFKNAKGPPTVYVSQYFDACRYCTYDDSGNLFATTGQSGVGVLAELAAGSSVIRFITVSKPFGESAGVQWVRGTLVLADATETNAGPATFYQVKVSGTTGTVVNTFQLSIGSGMKNVHASGVGFWVQGNRIIYSEVGYSQGTYFPENIGYWDYPAGGMVKKTIKVEEPLTVMVASAVR